MSKKCGHNWSCGCKDTALNTPPPCPQGIDCPEPTTCSEIWDANCVIYNGDPILELGISPGDSMNIIMNKLVLLATNPGCADPAADCSSVLNVHSITITSASVLLGWNNTPNATSYIVEYTPSSSISWVTNPAVIAPNHTDTITGLAPATEYYIRVNAFNSNGSPACSCYSLTIKVTTLAAT
jgi:hypothetical protein